MSKGILLRRHSCGNGIDRSLYENQYLTTEALESGTITFIIPAGVSTSNVTNVSYRKNGGAWTTTANSSSDITITVDVVTDDVIEWKGNATCYASGGSFAGNSHWGGTASFNVYGNLMSMLYNDSFIHKTEYPSTKARATQHMFSYALVVDATNLVLPATTCYNQAYMCLFDYCTSLIYPPAVLPAPIVKHAMYYNMFRGCTSMTTMPTILATSFDTTGTVHCYGMFIGCTALQYNTEQTIHIGTGRQESCREMFMNCSSMVNAPNIDCTSILNGSTNVFYQMFSGCTNLETPPERFDVDIVDYQGFCKTFFNCSSLLYAPIINIRNVGTRTYYAFSQMFYGCTSLADASGVNIYFSENSQWEGEYTFYQMFRDCTSMVHGPSLHINGTLITKSARTFGDMFFNCQNMETHDIELNYTIDSNATITTGSSYGNSNMFYHCYKMKTSPRITRLALRDWEFYRAFDGDSKLRDVYVKFNTNTAGNALTQWLENTGSLSGIRAVHQAGSLSLPNNSTSGIPSNWLLDQGDWTAQRHARMTMWTVNIPWQYISDWYDYENDNPDDYERARDEFIQRVIADPENQAYGESDKFYYYGDTMTIDNITYFIWENDNVQNTSQSKLLTTTDNFYELTKASLADGYDIQNLYTLGKDWNWIYGILSSNNLVYYNHTNVINRQIYNVKIIRNQG